MILLQYFTLSKFPVSQFATTDSHIFALLMARFTAEAKKFCEEVPICPRNSEAQNQKLVIRNHGDVLKNSHAATSSHQVPFSLNALRENILKNSAPVDCGPVVWPQSNALQLPFPRFHCRRRVPQINAWPRSQRVGEGRRNSIAKHLVEILRWACSHQCFLMALFSEPKNS